MKINLKFKIVPLGIQSMKVARIGNYIHKYQPKRNIDYKKTIQLLAKPQIPSDFKVIETCIIINKLIYTFPILKSMTKKVIKRIQDGIPLYKKSKPDLGDNLFKGLADALNGIIWKDDSQIVRINECYKIYGLEPSIEIEIEELDDLLWIEPLTDKEKENNLMEEIDD